jgi:hypothetical protein
MKVTKDAKTLRGLEVDLKTSGNDVKDEFSVHENVQPQFQNQLPDNFR